MAVAHANRRRLIVPSLAGWVADGGGGGCEGEAPRTHESRGACTYAGGGTV